MKTVAVPVDFSETSNNAAQYAARLLAGHNEIKMILYHLYEKDEDLIYSEEKLESLRLELTGVSDADISVLAEKGSDFIVEFEKFARHRKADLVVMGITGRSALAQVFIGSNTLKMAEQKVCPVLIIPAEAAYRDVKNVMLTTDFKNVVSATPSAPIKSVLKTFHPKLHIMSVDSEMYISLTEEMDAEKEKMKEMFAELNPEFYFLRLFNIEEAIKLFAEDKNIDMIITIQKEHSLLQKIFTGGHTKSLVYESSIPVLVVHE